MWYRRYKTTFSDDTELYNKAFEESVFDLEAFIKPFVIAIEQCTTVWHQVIMSSCVQRIFISGSFPDKTCLYQANHLFTLASLNHAHVTGASIKKQVIFGNFF